MLKEVIIIIAALAISLFLLYYIVKAASKAAMNESKLVEEQSHTNTLLRAYLVHSGAPLESFMTPRQTVLKLLADLKRLELDSNEGIINGSSLEEQKQKIKAEIARIKDLVDNKGVEADKIAP